MLFGAELLKGFLEEPHYLSRSKWRRRSVALKAAPQEPLGQGRVQANETVDGGKHGKR